MRPRRNSARRRRSSGNIMFFILVSMSAAASRQNEEPYTIFHQSVSGLSRSARPAGRQIFQNVPGAVARKWRVQPLNHLPRSTSLQRSRTKRPEFSGQPVAGLFARRAFDGPAHSYFVAVATVLRSLIILDVSSVRNAAVRQNFLHVVQNRLLLRRRQVRAVENRVAKSAPASAAAPGVFYFRRLPPPDPRRAW